MPSLRPSSRASSTSRSSSIFCAERRVGNTRTISTRTYHRKSTNSPAARTFALWHRAPSHEAQEEAEQAGFPAFGDAWITSTLARAKATPLSMVFGEERTMSAQHVALLAAHFLHTRTLHLEQEAVDLDMLLEGFRQALATLAPLLESVAVLVTSAPPTSRLERYLPQAFKAPAGIGAAFTAEERAVAQQEPPT
ncbi:hypothetical protein FA95DRAFT_1613939 [Auriscalpium vulgare]|uniref:Uncharacterized protein n=1 Tax=Auriscalpium vulgare TaxID=40419 RepID=A0ACB8R162_9AGAM|nr:hypothetical protein FA95DRAFT_1613939 [Auriscalpium vulgare]